MSKKRVVCLYRVSTKKQTKSENDIPVQKNACRDFIKAHDDWELFQEYEEPGISGYHKKLKDRKILQEMLKNVQEKKFDVLLVFMFDRLGRNDDETPFLLRSIVESGIEVWSVCEGQQKFENSSDDLMNYIRFWGAKTESTKTSRRVDSGRNYGTKIGKFTGGVVPYGYMLQPTGNLDKKGRMINAFVKEPKESIVVADIYRQLVDNNLTLNGIIDYLNTDLGLRTRKGCQWNTSTVRNILRNPIYKGYMSYGKTRVKKVKVGDNEMTSVQSNMERRQRSVPSDQWILAEECNPNYVIVDEDKWEMAQEILERRNKRYRDNLRPAQDRTWKSSLLLVGLLECGYCHGAISPAVSSQKSVSKTGEVTRSYTDFYKCNTRARNKSMCQAKSYISKYKLEKVVLDEVYGFLDRMEQIDCSSEIQKEINQNIGSDKGRLLGLQRQLAKVETGIHKMQEQILNSFMEETALDTKYINDAMKIAEKRKEELQTAIDSLEKEMKSKDLAIEEYQTTIKMIPVWREVFETAPINVKKHLLSILIEKIVVTGMEVDIYFKIDIDSFLNIQNISDKTVKKENIRQVGTENYRKIIEENVRSGKSVRLVKKIYV